MIVGIGTDIIEIERIQNAVNRTENFINKLFTEREIGFFEALNFKVETIASTFAAKEAVSKALGTGFRDFGPKDIEVTRNSLGKPCITLSKKVLQCIKNIDITKIHLTLSHCKAYAVAYVVIEGCEQNENSNTETNEGNRC